MKWLLAAILFLLLALPARAQGPIYLPVIIEDGLMALPDPVLRVTDGTTTVDLLGPGSGWRLADPYWNPQIAQYKGGGTYVNSGMAEGQRLVEKQYDNVIETIPLSVRGTDQAAAVRTVRELLQLGKQASDYWTRPYEYDDVWLEARPACNSCLAGYARIVKMSIPELTNPYGQPFFSSFNEAVMEGISLVVEREPLWRGLPPGQIIGPLYNLLKNPDFELWNAGVVDSQPDSWTDLETLQITGQNSREVTSPNSGQYALKIRVGSSVAAGKVKGVSQTVEGTRSNTEYTVVAWVRSEGVSNGVGRILVTYSGQLEVYRASTRHGWTLYTGTFTTGANDIVAINLEILTTAANTDGTIYVDSLMLLEGDWVEEAENDTLPYMSSSHIVNHLDSGAGDVNYVDAWDVPGDEDALVRLEMTNNTTPADATAIVEDIAQARVGQRRTGDVFDLQDYHDPAGVVDATCSHSDRVERTPSSAWADVSTHSIIGSGIVGDNVGRYRAFARVYDAKTSGDPTLQARLRYWMGVSSSGVKTLEGAAVPQRAAWNMVDVTPNRAVVWDAKGMVNLPGGLGCTLQFSRPSGTGAAYLDYLLLLPTDGGILTADIDPGIPPGIALVVDNTGSGLVGAAGIKNGYVLRTDTAAAYSYAMKEFKGAVYAGLVDFGTNTLIYRYFGGAWTLLDTVAGTVYYNSIEVYNGELYMSRLLAPNNYLYSSPDGITWTLRSTQIGGTNHQLLSFGGYLWWEIDDRIYRWDGSTATLNTTAAFSPTYLFTYGRQLYYSDNVNIYVWNGAGWTAAAAFGALGVASVYQEFNGRVFMWGGAGPGYLHSYDGNTISAVPGWPSAVVGSAAMVMDGVLYVGAANTIYSSTDGDTWTQIYDTSDETEGIIMIIGYEGTIHFGTTAGAIVPTAVLYSIVPDEAVEYSIADYQIGGGQNGGFTVPNRRFNSPKRHRWVFSWDRSSGANVIGDKALIGLGYVPRYLALRGAD